MKGIILKCAMEMVEEQFGGTETLNKILSDAGIGADEEVVIFEDLPDKMCFDFIQSAARILNIPEDDVMLAFGDYWVNNFAYRKYRIIYTRYKTSKEFLMGMGQTHTWATQSINGATPPQFVFESPGDNVLIMHYISTRCLDKILEGLIKGVLRFFKEKGDVEKIQSDKPGASCAYKIIFQ